MALIILSTAYFYVWKYQSKKPVFVTVIFVLLNLYWPFHLAMLIKLTFVYKEGSTFWWYLEWQYVW